MLDGDSVVKCKDRDYEVCSISCSDYTVMCSVSSCGMYSGVQRVYSGEESVQLVV